MLLKDAELRRRYEQAAATLAAKYDWATIGDKFGEVLETLARNASSERSRNVETAYAADVHG